MKKQPSPLPAKTESGPKRADNNTNGNSTPEPDRAQPISQTALSANIRFAPEFLSEADSTQRFLVNELVPAAVLCLWHGEPRVKKSWAALDTAIAVVTGTPAFGLERFFVPESVPVLYLSQEDPQQIVRRRARQLLKGRKVEGFP